MNVNLGNKTGNVNPLLLNFTPKGKIEEAEDVKYSYNDQAQTTDYDMRIVGTRSLKDFGTQKTKGSKKVDRKNEIDDSKSV